MPGRRIRRGRGGEVQLRLPAEERELLRGLPAQLRGLLDDEPQDPALRRLFPPAYASAPDLEAEYRRLMGDELMEKHVAALSVLEETVDSERISEEQAHSWLAAVNDLRLVLGTRLDVSEETLGDEVDPSDPQAPALALYAYLSWLQEQLVDALS